MVIPIWYVVIRETDVNITALTIFAQPVAGVAIAWLWLHESLHWGQLWGCLAIVAGLILGLSRQIKTKVAASIASPKLFAPLRREVLGGVNDGRRRTLSLEGR